MKRILFALPILTLLAAGCSFGQGSSKTQALNFTKPNLVEQGQLIYDVKLEGNQVIWLERTQKGKTQPDVYNLFMFQFDPQNSVGTKTQITNEDINKNQTVQDAYIFDNQIYWVEEDNQTNNLYHYNSASGKPELITSDVSVLFGVYNGNLVLEDNNYTSHYYYLYNLSTKQQTPINLPTNTLAVVLGDNNLCYSTDNGQNIAIYSLATNSSMPLLSLSTFEKSDFPGEYQGGFSIVDCSDKYIEFAFRGKNVSNPSPIHGLYIYNLSSQQNIPEPNLNANPLISGVYIESKFVGDSMYYSADESNIFLRDLITGQEQTLVTATRSPHEYNTWDTDSGYMAYAQKVADIQSGPDAISETDDLYLQKIQQ